MYFVAAFGVMLIAFSFWILSIQRDLNRLEEKTMSAMEQMGVQISAQWEILSSLLDLTEWYATRGCETIIETMSARRSITKYSMPHDVRKQENNIAETIREFREVAKIYPDLTADPNFTKAMDVLDQYKNTVQTSMLIYYNTVTALDRAIHMFPNSLFARVLGFSNHAIINLAER